MISGNLYGTAFGQYMIFDPTYLSGITNLLSRPKQLIKKKSNLSNTLMNHMGNFQYGNYVGNKILFLLSSFDFHTYFLGKR